MTDQRTALTNSSEQTGDAISGFVKDSNSLQYRDGAVTIGAADGQSAEIIKFPKSDKFIARPKGKSYEGEERKELLLPDMSEKSRPKLPTEFRSFVERLSEIPRDKIRPAKNALSKTLDVILAGNEIALPSTWEEAKGQVPGLLKWADAKKAYEKGRTLTIIDHLRDDQTGYGRWTLNEPGLPRYVLLDIDQSAYNALNAWLAKAKAAGNDDHSQLPSDVHVPTKSEYTDKLVSLGLVPADRLTQVGQALERRKQRAAGWTK